jgi:hypothetical protein
LQQQNPTVLADKTDATLYCTQQQTSTAQAEVEGEEGNDDTEGEILD